MRKGLLSALIFIGCLTSIQLGHAQSQLWGTSYSIATSGNVDGVLYHTNGEGDFYTEVHDFNPIKGSTPTGTRLLDIGNGLLYGMTQKGGADDVGTIFSYNPTTQEYTHLYEFNLVSGGRLPQGSLIQADDGFLYGMTSAGGGQLSGVIFRFNLSNNSLQTIINFGGVNGVAPYGDLLEASDGLLYGLTSGGGSAGGGTLFSFDPSNNQFNVLHTFGSFSTDGQTPYGSLIQATNGKLYGMTSAGGTSGAGIGTIFEYDLNLGYSKLIDFTGGIGPNNGSFPYGDLVEMTNNMLYGMTYRGGAAPNDDGVIFSFNANNNSYTKLHDLSAAPGPGSVGGRPNGSLMKASNNKLYGLCEQGGQFGAGTLFEFNPGVGVVKKVDFSGISNGATPVGTMMQANNGKLYGMTIIGGSTAIGTNPGFGVLFDYTLGATTVNKLLDFSPTINGYNPTGDLVFANGLLWGVCSQGGANNGGVIYSYDPVNLIYTKRLDLSPSTGTNPKGGLFLASNGLLYGTTQFGGNNNLGTFFGFNPNASAMSFIHSFAGGPSDGAHGVGSVAEILNGQTPMIYGVCSSGGLNAGVTGTVNDAGIIFEYNLNNGFYTKKYDFGGTTGAGISAAGGLIADPASNTLMGTNYGGGLGRGTVFEFNPVGSQMTILTNFPGVSNMPAYPTGDLLLSNNGLIYGHTSNGGIGNGGTLFEVNPNTGSYNTLQMFGSNPINYGATPYYEPSQANNSKIFGCTGLGSSTANGALYAYDIIGMSITSKHSFEKLQASSALYELPCNPKQGSISPVSCEMNYTSPTGNVYQQSGIYTETLLASNGCDSILTINLSITLIDTMVNQQDSLLTALSPMASVQWLDCNNNYSIIPGATNPDFIPSVSGSYAGQLTENGCVDTTMCYTVNRPVSIRERQVQSFTIYPNPSNGEICIEIKDKAQIVRLSLFNLLGQTVDFTLNQSKNFIKTEAPSGIYQLIIQTEKGIENYALKIE